MSASLMFPCSQPSYIAPAGQRQSSVIDRSPGILNFSAFNPYGSCQNSSHTRNFKASIGDINLSPVVNITSITNVSVDRAFNPESPSDSSATYSLKSIASPVSVASPSSLNFFNTEFSLRKSQSTLIMPNILTFFRQGPQKLSSHDDTNIDRGPNYRLSSSTKSLTSMVGEHATFPGDPASPQPLIRKCHTVIALSNAGKNSPTNSTSKLVRDKSSKLNILQKISSSKSAIFSTNRTAPISVLRKSETQRWRKNTLSMWPDLEEEDSLEALQKRLDPSSRSCSKCTSTASLTSSRRQSTSDGLFCNLCLCEVSIKRIYQLQQCQCRFCTYCMTMYTTLRIREGDPVIECPDSNCDCNGELTMEEIETLVGNELFNIHIQFRRNREIDLDPLRTWCPTPGCDTAVMLASSKFDGRPQCCSCACCELVFCACCSYQWHPGKPCYKAEAKAELPINECIKRCPRCKVPIERDAGCAQMQCKKCKHVFCWYCLASLEDDFLLRHYDKGPCKNKLGHSRASVLWHRAQVVIIFAGFGLLLVVASPVLLFIGPCLLCRSCKGSIRTKYEMEDDTFAVL